MPATLHYIGRDQAAQALFPVLAGQSENGLMWHPLIYVGQWEHPAFGAFEITHDDLFAMASAFQGGVPTSLGVPIDEWNNHEINKEGAFGWVKALEVRDDALWVGYTLTPLGQGKVKTEELPFLSAHFFVRGSADNLYKSESYVQSVALTSRPFFWEQPQLPVEQIAASAYVRKDDNDGGDVTMGADARKKIEALLGKALTDDEWQAMTKEIAADAGQEEWDNLVGKVEADVKAKADADAKAKADADAAAKADADAAAKAKADAEAQQKLIQDAPPMITPEQFKALAEKLGELGGKLDALEAKNAELEEANKQAVAVAASAATQLSAVEAEKRKMQAGALRAEIAATMLGRDRDRVLTDAATELMCNALTSPTAETVGALWEHIKQTGGLASYRKGEVAAAAAAPLAPDVQQQLEALGAITPGTRRKLLEQHAATGESVPALYRKHVAAMAGRSV